MFENFDIYCRVIASSVKFSNSAVFNCDPYYSIPYFNVCAILYNSLQMFNISQCSFSFNSPTAGRYSPSVMQILLHIHFCSPGPQVISQLRVVFLLLGYAFWSPGPQVISYESYSYYLATHLCLLVLQLSPTSRIPTTRQGICVSWSSCYL